ncbi:MAG: hypothetical protein R3A48_06075 [Polyangiales bacterium]
MARPFSKITSRDEFFVTLERTHARLAEESARTPEYDLWPLMLRQLDAMREWTAGGREPSAEERERVTVGTLAARELDTVDDAALASLGQDLSELQYFFQVHYPDVA